MTKKYREPLPEGTKVRMLRSIAGAKKGEVYTAYPLEDGTVLVRNDRWDLYLYGPNACEQFREGVTWEVVT